MPNRIRRSTQSKEDQHGTRGFTLIELFLCIAIIAISRTYSASQRQVRRLGDELLRQSSSNVWAGLVRQDDE